MMDHHLPGYDNPKPGQRFCRAKWVMLMWRVRQDPQTQSQRTIGLNKSPLKSWSENGSISCKNKLLEATVQGSDLIQIVPKRRCLTRQEPVESEPPVPVDSLPPCLGEQEKWCVNWIWIFDDFWWYYNILQHFTKTYNGLQTLTQNEESLRLVKRWSNSRLWVFERFR